MVRLAILALGLLALTTAVRAQDGTSNDLARALRNGDVDLELRYRYEFVDIDALSAHANASLLRTRLTYASAAFRNLTFALEIDDLRPIVSDDFNDTRNGKLDRPVVADPEGTEVNQAFLGYQTTAGTRLALGRQRVTVPRRRFVASLNWRLNEQTFDALTAVHTFDEGLRIDYAYVWNVNRLFGPDSGIPPPDLDGAIHVIDARYTFDSGAGLHGYGYFLDFDDAADLSNANVGLRFTNSVTLTDTLSLPYAIEVARQSDYGDNPIGYDADYINLEAGLSGPRLRVNAGYERLEGDGTPGRALQTPLAGLNGVNGWADLFVTTPDDGLVDASLALVVPLDRIELSLIAHEYSAAHGSADYGSELNVALSWPIDERYELLFRLADYQADTYSVDTTKAWVMLTARF